MTSKVKNIIIITVVGIVLVLIYVFFIRKAPEQAALVSTSPDGVTTTDASSQDPITKEFLTLLLSVKSIKLDSAIFSDPTFATLHDSSIVLTPDGSEGRVNPFAPIGSENLALPASKVSSGSGAGVSSSTPNNTLPATNNTSNPSVLPPVIMNNPPPTPPAH